MASGIANVTGDFTAQWNITPGTPTTHFDKVSEDPATPDLTDYISAGDSGKDDTFGLDWDAAVPAGAIVDSVTFLLSYRGTPAPSIPGVTLRLWSHTPTEIWAERNVQLDSGGGDTNGQVVVTGLAIPRDRGPRMRYTILSAEGDEFLPPIPGVD